MKHILIFIALVLCQPKISAAQEVKSWNGRFGKIEYLDYQSSGSPENLWIVDLPNGKSRDELATDLIPVANKLKAKFVLIELSKSPRKAVNDVFLKRAWMTESIVSITMVAFQENAVASLEQSENCNRYVFINPVLDTSIKNMVLPEDLLLSAILESDNDESRLMVQEMEKKNIWTKRDYSQHIISFPSDAFISSIKWMDSLSSIIDDSVSYSQTRSDAGVKSMVPEVMRQGKPIEVKINVIESGECHIEILNLSTQVVFSQKQWLGKGSHIVKIPTKNIEWGVYNLEINGRGFESVQKFMIRG